MSLITENKIYHIRSKVKEFYDVLGAGDIVIVILLTAVSTGINVPDVNATAGMV